MRIGDELLDSIHVSIASGFANHFIFLSKFGIASLIAQATYGGKQSSNEVNLYQGL
jgi:hypothetical protein